MLILFWIIAGIMLLVTIMITSWSLVKRHSKIVIGIGLVITLMTGGIYYYLGSIQQYQNFLIAQSQAQLVRSKLAAIKNPQQIIDQLKQHLQQHPQSAQGWYLLARLYMGTGDYPNAQHTFALALALKPTEDAYAVGYAEAVFFNNSQRLTPKTNLLLSDILKRSPNNIAALNLLAVDAYRGKKYAAAIQIWQHMLALTPSDSPDYKKILKMLEIARVDFHNDHF